MQLKASLFRKFVAEFQERCNLNEFGGVANDANNLLVTTCSSPSVPAIHHIHSADSKHIEVPFTSSFIGGKLPPW